MGTNSTTAESTSVEQARQRLALPLDVDDLVVAQRLASEVKPYFGVAKVGLELYSAAGPDAVGVLRDMGMDVFVDLKLFDIPTTVERAARVIGALGAKYLTVHAHGGPDVLDAAVEGFESGAAGAGLPTPITVAITVLTSDGSAPAHIVPERLKLAAERGCRGVVCAASDLAGVDTRGLQTVVPGIRPKGASHDDQSRVSTPGDAIRAGADLLVVGRPVTRAVDPHASAQAINREVAEAIAGRANGLRA